MTFDEFLDELQLAAGRREDALHVDALARWRAACELFARETLEAFEASAPPVVSVIIHPSGNAWLRRATGWVRDGCGELAELGPDGVEALRRHHDDPTRTIRQLCRDRGGHAFYSEVRPVLDLARIDWRRHGRSGVSIDARFLFADLGRGRRVPG